MIPAASAEIFRIRALLVSTGVQGPTMSLLLCLLVQNHALLDSGTHDAKPGDDPLYERISDDAALKALWDRLPPSPTRKDRPKVDFSTKMVLAVFPSFESDRKHLAIESLKEEKGILTVALSLMPIAVEGGPGLRLPYVLIEVPRSVAPVHFVESLKEPATGKLLRTRTVKKLEALK
jgi:hypothetical protein